MKELLHYGFGGDRKIQLGPSVMDKVQVKQISSATDSVAPIWRPSFIISVMISAAFGPYLVGSIRTEQVAVYGFFLLTLPAILTGFNPRGGLRFFVPWFLYITIATLGVIAPFSGMPYRAGNVLAGYDNLLSPLVIMLLIWTIIPTCQARDLLTMASKIISLAMAINGLIAVVATVLDLNIFLRPFWGNASVAMTVAENAGIMGRSTGIFNQPAEAGALYSLAGIAAIFAWKERPFLLAWLIPLIVMGGLVSVSKIFVLGGLPIIIFYWLWACRATQNIFPFTGAVLILIGIMQSKIMAEWSGLSYLQRLFAIDDQSLLGLYGAGRFSEGSSFFQILGSVASLSPIAGVGAGGWQIPYDGAISEFFVIGGLLGLGSLFIVLISMFSLSLQSQNDRPLQVFSFLVFISTAAASLGFSPLTGNRISTITWVLIALLVLAIRDGSTKKKRDKSRVPLGSV